MSDEQRRKLSRALKGRRCPWQMGDKNPAKRPEVRTRISESLKIAMNRPETKEKHRKAVREALNTPEARENISRARCIALSRPEVRIKLSERQLGEKNHQWRGGISFGSYCPKFNKEFKERVRAFWGYECGNCGKSQAGNGRKLGVHHVNYQKDACCEEDVVRQFIPLCATCHSRTNKDREKWQKKLTKIIEKKFGGKCYFHKAEVLTAWGVA